MSAPPPTRPRARPRAATRLVAAPLVVTALVACSALVDLDDLGGGEPLEASAPRLEAGPRADTDGVQPLVPGDADAALPNAACEGGARFCDDFERGEPRGAWTRLLATGDAGVSIETEPGGNRFLEARVAASDTGRGVELVHVDDAGATSATLRARLRLGARAPGTRAELLGVAFEAAPTVYAVLALRETGLGLLVTAGPVTTFQPLAGTVPTDDATWLDVTIRVEPSRATLQVGDATVEATLPPFEPAATQGFVGFHFVESPAALTAAVDDVSLSR